MATLHRAGAPPKRRMATYGKTVRKRIPEYSFASSSSSVAIKSQKADATVEHEVREREREREPTSSPRIKSAKLKGIQQRAPSRPASPGSPAKANIFDVPSSDEDAAPPTPKPAKPSQKTSTNRPTKKASPKEAPEVRMQNNESRKRLKLSPAPKMFMKPLPSNITVPPPPPSMAPAAFAKHRSQGKGQTSTMVARPKPKLEKPEPKRPRTPQKISLPPNNTVMTSTPSPQLSDVDMMDVDPEAKYISPKGLKMWKDLLESTDNVVDPSEIHGEKSRISRVSPEKPVRGYGTAGFKSSGVTKHPRRTGPSLPRRRLIDSLVGQVTRESSDESDSEDSISESMPGIILNPSAQDAEILGSQSLASEPNTAAQASGSQSSQNAGPKFTYLFKQRSMLAEEDLMKQLALDMPSQPAPLPGRKARRGSIPTLQPLPSFHDEDEDEDGKGAAIRSVHELRQAGANSRFLDEIEDLLDRIGSPTGSQMSMRRSGLLDMAGKMKDKNFARQFRSNGVEMRLFVHLGQETDLISGYLMISLLISVLIEGSVPHIVLQLRRQGVARLLIRLLDHTTSIMSVAKERVSNMSKLGQKMLLEHHDFLRQLPMWEDLQPQTASPRTVALKCLELMVMQAREAGNGNEIFSKELTTKLFGLLKGAADNRSWSLPTEQQAIDFYLALSALEFHSVTARTVHDENIWIVEYLPTIADTLEIALSKPTDDFGVLHVLMLRLTLNVTNNNPKASDVFARGTLMSAMGEAIVAKFKKISAFLMEEEFSNASDQLILLLGVMINFADWSSAARGSLQSLRGGSNDPLNRMVQLLLDSQERTSEAESMEDGSKNVAFGYLSVLLGYFSLLPEISGRIRNCYPRKNLRPLIASIEEFIVHHKAADQMIAADDDGHSPQSGLTERLESLVHRLGTMDGAGK
ncbi:hypothetical protein LSUE1_G000011 [Lachnellula suecica]|uniref:Wings apart-like protein C-terminal domain-containing protein n=1 Tax=Lachnellula suecica TaxID=602035 RepID=A0A8T9CHS8_9HELO|nr:hypothetical protein LSUE1_G000011 [Lachnellula suecica]